MRGKSGPFTTAGVFAETPWLRRFRILFPIGECIAIHAPATGRGMTRCVGRELWLLKVQCVAQKRHQESFR